MRYLLPCLLALVLSSCDNVSSPPDKNRTSTGGGTVSVPGEGSRYGKGGDVIDEMYDEVVDNDANLKTLEKDIRALSETIGEASAPYKSFSRTNEDYYHSAARHIASIKDSALRQKIRMMIDNNRSAYNKSVAPHERLVNDINWKQATLEDLHTYLVLVKTLPVMEEYQKKNLPATAPLEKVSAEHDRVNQRTKDAANR